MTIGKEPFHSMIPRLSQMEQKRINMKKEFRTIVDETTDFLAKNLGKI